jgi:hypothetical protein
MPVNTISSDTSTHLLLFLKVLGLLEGTSHSSSAFLKDPKAYKKRASHSSSAFLKDPKAYEERASHSSSAFLYDPKAC